METKKSNTKYGTCRFCSAEGDHYDIFKEYSFQDTKEVYLDIIMECFNIFLSMNCELGSLVCTVCVQRLREANSFRLMLLKSEQHLMKTVIEEDAVFVYVRDHDLDASGNIKTEDGIEVKEEVVSENPTQPTDCESDCSLDNNEDNDDFKPETAYEELVSKDRARNVTSDCSNDVNDFSDPDMAEGEAALLSRFRGSNFKLPVRNTLRLTCPDFFRHLEHLKGKVILPKMVAKLVEDSEKKRTTLNRRWVYITEKMAHIMNASTILENSNATPFKSKNRSGFPCFYCRSIHDSLDRLKEHQLRAHRKCEIRKILATYGPECLVVYVDVTDLTCAICNERTSNLNTLKNHLTKIHKKTLHTEFTDRVIPFKLSQDNIYECQACGFSFETFGSIERHMNTHYRNYVCKECGTGFITKYRLKVHIKAMHCEGSYPCEVCKKVYSTPQKLKNHVDTVHKMVKRFKCPKCPERFSEYFRRQRHLVETHGVAPLRYKCNVCERSFDRRYTLSRHMKRDHLEERDFQCDVCSYKCFTRNELRVHMVKHGGERIFECLICKKSYARKKTLKEHMRIHNNDRRFSCSVCGQAFVQKCSLKGHLKTHHLMYGVQ